jgi:hypothetical protein
MNDKKKSEAIDEFYNEFTKTPVIDLATAKPSEIINWAQSLGNVFERFYNRAYTDGYRDGIEVKV